jgi:hypothetical protein
MDLREIGCEDGKWMELVQDRVQWWARVLTVLNLLDMPVMKELLNFRFCYQIVSLERPQILNIFWKGNAHANAKNNTNNIELS